MLKFFGSGQIKAAVREHLLGRGDLVGKRALDIPAGSGVNSVILRDAGADVEALDLIPDFFSCEGVTCDEADLNDPLPLDSARFDLVLFQEAIEHLPNAHAVLRELNRVLKRGGTLLVTTPNVSHLRARLSHFLLESDLYNRLPPDRAEAVWFRRGLGEDSREYYGHIHLIGAQKLRLLARLAGFRLRRVLPVKVSVTSLLLMIFYPLLAVVSVYAYVATSRRRRREGAKVQDELREMLWLNLHPTVLAGKHLFLEFEKTAEADEDRAPVTKPVASIH